MKKSAWLLALVACSTPSPRTATLQPAFPGWSRITPDDLEISALLPSPVAEETLDRNGRPLRHYYGEQGGVRFSLATIPLPRASLEPEKEEIRKQALEAILHHLTPDHQVINAIPWSVNDYGGISLSLSNAEEKSHVQCMFSGSHAIALVAKKKKIDGTKKSVWSENQEFFSSLKPAPEFKKKYPTPFFPIEVIPTADGWQTVYVPPEKFAFQVPGTRAGSLLYRISYNRHGKKIFALKNAEDSLPSKASCEIIYFKASDTPSKELESILDEETGNSTPGAGKIKEKDGLKTGEVTSKKGDTIEVFRLIQSPSLLIRIRATEGPQNPPGPAVQRCLNAVQFGVLPPPKPSKKPKK